MDDLYSFGYGSVAFAVNGPSPGQAWSIEKLHKGKLSFRVHASRREEVDMANHSIEINK